MISLLKGKVLKIDATSILIEVNIGVAFTVYVPQSYLVEKLDLISLGKEVVLYTHLKIKDDEPILHGFLTLEEKELFLRLIQVSGVGMKTALSLIGNLGVKRILDSLKDGNVALLKSVSGVGEKTAKRIILEMKGELVKLPQVVPQEAEEALINMGFKKVEINKAWQNLSEKESLEKLTIEELIKSLLKVIKK